MYEVRTSGAAESGATGLTTSGTTAAGVVSANITGLTDATTYYVYVKSNCGSGDYSTWTSAYSFVTSSVSAPTALAADPVGSTSFTAIWNTVPGASGGYLLDVSTSTTFGTSGVSATLSEGFINGTTAPSGWTFTSISGTYTTSGNYGASSPSIRFDASNDRVQTSTLSGAATSLSFWIKGQGATGSYLLVEGYNGSTWSTIDNILLTFITSGTTKTYTSVTSPALPSNLVQFRFTYTAGNGNLAFDDVSIIYNSFTPSFVTDYNSKAIAGQSTTSSAVNTNLASNTNYYYRLRAVGGKSTSANSTPTITVVTLATLSTTAASGISTSGASTGGTIDVGGGADVTARGVCYGTSANPTTSDLHTSNSTGTGSFTSTLSGLSPNTTYHIRAYAINGGGTNYGNDLTFTTSASATSTFSGTGNWTTGTWSNGLPGSNTNVTISGSVIVNDVVECNDLTIDPSGSVTVSSGQGLIVDGNFLIQSTAAGTGSFIGNAADYTITGTKTVQRFLTKYNSASDNMFHFLSSPVAAQAIRPTFVANSPASDVDFYSWKESTNMWINTRAAVNTWNSLFEDNFAVGKGYMVAYPADITKNFIGTLNTGDKSPTLTYTSGQGDGWNLAGNPYPSAIDWDNVDVTQYANLDNAVYVYDNASQTYKSWVTNAGSLTDGIIPAMQGFYVKASAASPTLTLTNGDRVHGGATYYKSTKAVTNLLSLKIEGNNRSDETFVRFTNDATTGFDGQWDAYKLMGGTSVPNLYTTTGDTKYSVNSLPERSLTEPVPLAVAVGANTTYTLTLTGNTILTPTYITLEDLKTGVSQRLDKNPAYTFTANTTDNAGRFLLHFLNATSIPDPARANAFTVRSNDGIISINTIQSLTGKVVVSDMVGRTIARAALVAGSPTRINLNGKPGIYVVSVISSNGISSQKVMIY